MSDRTSNHRSLGYFILQQRTSIIFVKQINLQMDLFPDKGVELLI